MTIKDYELIAKSFYPRLTGLKSSGLKKDIETIDHISCIAMILGELLEKDNPKFDYNKFLKACGVLDVKTLLEQGRHDLLSEEAA